MNQPASEGLEKVHSPKFQEIIVCHPTIKYIDWQNTKIALYTENSSLLNQTYFYHFLKYLNFNAIKILI